MRLCSNMFCFLQLILVDKEVHNNMLNPLSANFTKWSNTLKQFVGKLPTNCLNVFDHLVGLALKGLSKNNKFHIDATESLSPNLASSVRLI